MSTQSACTAVAMKSRNDIIIIQVIREWIESGATPLFSSLLFIVQWNQGRQEVIL